MEENVAKNGRDERNIKYDIKLEKVLHKSINAIEV